MTGMRFPPARLLTAVFLLCGVVAVAPLDAQQRSPRQVLLLSDIHFNPFPTPQQCQSPSVRRQMAALAARPPETWNDSDFSFQNGLSHRGEDTNWLLLRSTIAAIKMAVQRPAAVIISGDMLVHQGPALYEACFADKGQHADPAAMAEFFSRTIAFELALVERTYPGVQVVMALGNNDSDAGDYKLPSAAMLADLTPVIESATNAGGNAAAKDFARTYATGGYFSAELRKFDHAEILVLNTNALTPRAQDDDTARSGPAAQAEIAWLKQELDVAQQHHRNVVIVGHVPPGIDAWASHQEHAVVMMYAKQQLPAILAAHSTTVRMGLFGHTHMDDFRVAGEVPVSITPSISPIVENNPAFEVLETDAQFRPLNHIAWNLPLDDAQPQWRLEYDFRSAYSEANMSGATLRQLSRKLANDPTLRHTFYWHFGSESAAADVPEKWQPVYLCAFTNLTEQSVTPCLLESLGLPAPF